MTREETCEKRIDSCLEGRLATIATLVKLTEVSDQNDLDTLSVDEYAEIDYQTDDRQRLRPSEVSEAADNRLYEMRLSIERLIVIKVTLGTGGPGDWFEAFYDEPGDGGVDFEARASNFHRIVYHYNNWFDHAERTLDGDQADTARAFVERVAGID